MFVQFSKVVAKKLHVGNNLLAQSDCDRAKTVRAAIVHEKKQ